MTDELKKIYPAKTYTLANGDEVSVSPVKFKNLVKFGEALTSLLIKVREAGMSLDPEKFGAEEVIQVLQIAYNETVKIMSIAMDKPVEWFGELDATDAIGLLAVIIEQNLGEDAKKKIAMVLGSLMTGPPST